eukprot:4715_1
MSQLGHDPHDVDLNLWSFIRSTKATQLASLRSLQKFVLSLNKEQLTHIIQCYLQSQLLKTNSFKANGLPVKQTFDRVFNHESKNNSLQSIDKQIISKLNIKYEKKYHKKVIAKTAQQKSDNQRHLLSIPPHVLAYSFQFLSFRELCKAQCVCVHFVYLNKKYPALTHYYFKMNVRFRQKAMRSRVLLSNLSFFKHICITDMYCNGDNWRTGTARRRRCLLFQYLLKTIIKQSKSTLDTLEIYLYVCDGYNVINFALNQPAFNVLLYIMNEFDQLPISKLIWKMDYFKPSINCTMQHMLKQIQTQFVNTFPNLTSLCMGRSRKLQFVRNGNVADDVADRAYISHTTLKRFILIPLIHDFAVTLQSIEIPYQNANVIPLIAQRMVNLTTLTISSTYDTEFSDVVGLSAHAGGMTNIILKRLCLNLVDSRSVTMADGVTILLMSLFSTFIGVTEFEFNVDTYWNSSRDVCVDWHAILHTLFNNKRRYSMNNENDALQPLESLRISDVFIERGERVIQALLDLKYCDLKYIDMSFAWQRPVMETFTQFVTDSFQPFLKMYHNARLNRVKLKIAGSPTPWSLESVLNVLDSLPPSLTSIHFTLPSVCRESLTINDGESTKFIKKLCQMSLEINEGSKLECITFDGIKMSACFKRYLSFWFGFHNKITIVNHNYYLQFT